MKRETAAALVVLAGVSAALHVGKLPPALPVLTRELGISLVQAGFLLSAVQIAGMLLGLAAGTLADAVGLRRTMFTGLAVLGLASIAGAFAPGAYVLLALRAAEGLGFLMTVTPAPALIRSLVEPARASAMLGWWGAYMPLGTAIALLFGPLVIAAGNWPALWLLLGALSLCGAAAVYRFVPRRPATVAAQPRESWGSRVIATLTSRGPWLAAASFCVYSGQWLAVVGFLPSIYAQAGVPAAWTAVATALAAGINMVGNIGSGRLLLRGARPRNLLHAGFAAMALGALLAFSPLASSLPGAWAPAVRYAGVLLFSAVGGLIPGTLFSLASRLAPDERAISGTVGWMQQLSALGQFTGPPLVGFVVSRTGSWDHVWLVTGACAAAGALLAFAVAAAAREPSVK